jgi:hypothetical protein
MQTARQTTLKITPAVRKVLVQIIDQRIKDVHVTKEDFSELKAIVKNIAEIQQRTELKLEEVASWQEKTDLKMEQLVDAQKKTDLKMGQLVDAQKKTDLKMGQLVDAQKHTDTILKKLAMGLDATRSELGGLSRSVGYSLENEAYRQLPRYLQEAHNITLTDRMVRFELDGEEINLFAKGSRNGKEFFIVGESALKLSSVGKLRQLEKKVSLVKKHYGGECLPMMITHFARPQVLEAATKKGIMIVQSFEW